MKEFLGQDFSVGSTVTFGNFEDKRFEDKHLEWLVLSNDGNKAKLLCTRSVTIRHHSIRWYSTCHWEMSRARTFLKYTFLPTAFNEEEQALLNECGIYGNLVTLLSEDDFNEYYNGPLHDKLHEIFNAIMQVEDRYIKLLPGMAFEEWDNEYYGYNNIKVIKRPENTTEYDFYAVPCQDGDHHVLPVIEVKLQNDNTVIDLTEICCGENCTKPANRDRIRFGEEVIFGKSAAKDDFYCSSDGRLHWVVIGTAGNKVQLLCKSLPGCIEDGMGSWHDSYLHYTVFSDFKHYCFTEEERELILAYRDMADCFERPVDYDDDEVKYIDIKDRKLICDYGADSDDQITLLSFAELQELHSKLPSEIFKSLIVRGNGDSACYWMRPTAENNRDCYWFSEKGNCLYDSPNIRYKADDYYYLPVITVALPFEVDGQGEGEQISTESLDTMDIFNVDTNGVDQSGIVDMASTAETELQQDSPLAEKFINGTESKQDFSVRNTELQKIKENTIVTFGNYKGKSLEWLVINECDGLIRLLCLDIVSKMKLVKLCYEGQLYTWEESDVVKFLNEKFMQASFSEEEINAMYTYDGVAVHDARYVFGTSEELVTALEVGDYEKLTAEQRALLRSDNSYEWLQAIYDFSLGSQVTVADISDGSTKRASVIKACGVRPVIALLIDAVPEGSLVVKENALADKEKSFLDEDGFDKDLDDLFDNDLSYGDLLIDSDTLVEEEEVNDLDSMDIFNAIDDFSGDTICEIPVGGNPLIDVFTNKQVLAGILLNVVGEYDRCAHDTVCDFIDSVSYDWVSADHVEYSEDSDDILRVAVNSSADGYRKIVTQIFFDLTTEKTADNYYDLDQAVGYHSKIVSDAIDKNGSFSQLPSIYSVWVRVRNLTPEWRNTFHNFNITGEDNNGKDVTNLVRHSDLMNVTTILLAPNYNWDADDQIIVKFLQSILNNRLYDRGFNKYLDTSDAELCEAVKTLAELLHLVDDTTRALRLYYKMLRDSGMKEQEALEIVARNNNISLEEAKAAVL